MQPAALHIQARAPGLSSAAMGVSIRNRARGDKTWGPENLNRYF